MKPYVKSLDSWLDLPHDPPPLCYAVTPPPYGSNWGHKIDDFVLLPYISFINALTALERITRY